MFESFKPTLTSFTSTPRSQDNSQLGPNPPTTIKLRPSKINPQNVCSLDFPLTENKMVPPPAKKQKVESVPMSPIVFQSPGLKPVASLKVIDVEFYAHSIILKLHSAFFRKFLDAANKAASPSTNGTANLDASGSASDGTTPPEASATRPFMVFGEFKYHWVTKIDKGDENKWHLVLDDPKVSRSCSRFLESVPTKNRMSLSMPKHTMVIRLAR